MAGNEDQNRLQLALEAAGLDLWENDLATGEVTHPASRTFVELGYSAEDAADSMRFWLDIVHPEDRPAIDAALADYRDGRADNYRAEFRLRTKSGNWLWYANYGRVMTASADPALKRFIGVTFNIDDRKRREEEMVRINALLSLQNQQLDQMNNHLEQLSTTDPLTRLHNRRAVHERLHQLLAADGTGFGVLFVDLDDFKKINDLYGHDVGDILLCQVAQRLQACLDAGDMIARFGGDEFVLIVHARHEEGEGFRDRLAGLCGQILGMFAQPYAVSDLQLYSYGSIGVACAPEDGRTVEALTKRADIALYRAKKLGRNRHQFFEPGLEAALQNQDNIERELRSALKSRQLTLLYQIQVDRELRPVGAEALLRWYHPARGLLLPGDFLPDAVACDLIHDIDYWVLENACATLGKWQNDPLLKDMTLAVNVTAKAVEHPAFVQTVVGVLEKYALSQAPLMLEITEHVRAQSFAETARVIQQLHAHGVRFSLDDFGTGYSALESLKHLPFDEIKIDGAFVQDVTDSPVSQAAIACVVTLAKQLGIHLVAECVEQREQLEHLRARGVDAFQGYLFGLPLPQQMLEEMLRQTLQADAA